MAKEVSMNKDFIQGFKWTNQSEAIIKEGSVLIKAHPNSDFFNDPAGGGLSNSNAAFFHAEANGDFVLKARVSHSFIGVYDACALMVMRDETCWAKLCFEKTDFGTHAVVSVVTNGVSDDANGVNVDGNAVYLQMARKGNVIALHYSLDGNGYEMVRYFSLPLVGSFKVGFVAQSPLGGGGGFLFEDIVFENRSVADLRKGV